MKPKFIAVATAITVAASGCGSKDDSADAPMRTTKAVPCRGEPVVVGTITSLGGPAPLVAMMGGVRAAAAAVNHTCAAGRPVKLVACDDKGDPSLGADCGRKVVKSKAIALVGSGGVTSAKFEPIVQDAGIPSVGNLAGDPNQLLRETSFPSYNILARAAQRAALTYAAGAKTVSVLMPENPAIQAQLPTFRKVLGSFGIKVDRFVFVPADATDLAQYASQAAEGDSVMILVDVQVEGILRELLTIGVTPKSKPITAPELTQKQVDRFGAQIDGLLMSSPTIPLTETSNEGIAAYLAETKAAGIDDHSVNGLIAWRAMHVVAEVVKDLPSLTTASLIKRLERHSFAPPEAAPVDFSKHAFPTIALFKPFRIFSRKFAVWRVEDGKIKLAVPDFVDPSTPFALT